MLEVYHDKSERSKVKCFGEELNFSYLIDGDGQKRKMTGKAQLLFCEYSGSLHDSDGRVCPLLWGAR